MKVKLTNCWIKKHKPCQGGINWLLSQPDKERNSIIILERLIKENKLDWANWTIVRCMNYKQYVSYAVYSAKCAEQEVRATAGSETLYKQQKAEAEKLYKQQKNVLKVITR